MSHAVEVSHLRVQFAGLGAVDDVTLRVDYGEVVTLLGPNGAGKTTLVETLLGFRRPSSGTVRLHGLDPHRDHHEVVVRTGALLQRGGVWAPMTPAEVIRLTAAYYQAPRDANELMTLLQLEGCARTPWRRLSGGEQQRTLLALALVGRPRVLVLDEPTTAVDPEGRQVIRDIVRAERDRGCALLITTHELNEAERLADRLVVMNRGHVVIQGTLDELAGAPEMIVETSAPVDAHGLSTELACGVVLDGPRRLRIATASSPDRVAAVTDYLTRSGVSLVSLRTRASLEERYLQLIADESRGGAVVRAWWSQTRAEVRMTVRRGETLLLTVGIPVLLLVFFSLVHVTTTPTAQRVDFVAPGILALCVLSTSLVALSIATGFERSFGVLRRLYVTPLGQRRLIGAKIAGVVVTEVLQVVILSAVALLLHWHPRGGVVGGVVVTALLLLGSAGCAGIGLALAGRLRAEVNLAATNGLYLVLLLLSGIVVPATALPTVIQRIVIGLPSGALADGLHRVLGLGTAPSTPDWIALAAWAIVAPLFAARTFRFD